MNNTAKYSLIKYKSNMIYTASFTKRNFNSIFSAIHSDILMKCNRFFLTAILTCFSALYAFADDQFTIDRQLEWYDAPQKIFLDNPDVYKEMWSFKGAAMQADGNSFLPVFTENFYINGPGDVTITILDAEYEPLAVSRQLMSQLSVSEQIIPSYTIGMERKKSTLDIHFVPIRKNTFNGNFEKLVSFKLQVTVRSNSGTFRESSESDHDYSAQSFLRDGNWYKIGISNEGVYKIDQPFLESIGINTAAINTATFGVFGHAGGMLPEANAKDNYDDINELAIYRVGLEDGSFDAGDYVLFYGRAADQWTYDPVSGEYKFNRHIYSNQNYYFITTNRGTNKTIAYQANSAETPDYTSTAYDYTYAWDNDVVNLIASGRRWFDTPFDNFSNAKTYSASIPNILTSESGNLRYYLAAKSSAGSSTFSISGSGYSNTVSIALTPESTENNYANIYSTYTPFTPTSASALNFNVTFSGPSGSKGWVDYIEATVRCALQYNSAQLLFKDKQGIGAGNITRYLITAPDDLLLWDVTDPLNVKTQAYLYTSGQIDFTLPSDSLKRFALLQSSNAFPSSQITFVGVTANQNIHNIANAPDLVIITHPDFLSQARQLAAFHKNENGYDTLVVTTTQVYNEFSSGTPDLTAIRNMMRMFYDRAGSNAELLPQYLLLFGDASFDYKNITFAEEDNTNRVPTYESYESIHQVYTFPTDDYTGCLDDTEGKDMSEDVNKLDIGIGRLPVATVTEAQQVVDKIMGYNTPQTFGSWRNTLCFVADDEDNNTHIDDADDVARWVSDNHPLYNINKIYLDAYQQIPGAGGQRYPEANQDLNNQIFQGTLIMNWTGHGNEQNWAQERVLGVDDINSWTNADKLPLFITATCSFSRFDNPDKTSAGELILLSPQGGGIGLVTTVRIVYAYANYILTSNFFYNIFQETDGEFPTLGEALVAGKNAAGGGSLQAVNNRKFLLLGDPALRLNYPKYKVVATEVNNTPIAGAADTLKALEKVVIKGEIQNAAGEKLTDYNGVVYPNVFDKPLNVTTLVNDPGKSNPYTFSIQKNSLYKGKASVTNGEFEFTFIVPKDISYLFGNGKLSFYAENSFDDAAGYELNVIIGGTADSITLDNTGPEVSVYMNDEKFVFGGLTDENPVLYIKLEDENGINTVGNGIGHDIIALLNDENQGYTLNDYYEAELDSYQKGIVNYPLRNLPAGRHSIKVTAWDVYNNSGEGYTEFVVAENARLALDHVLNYPNPFTTHTAFWFEHNRPGDVLEVKVEIFSVSGKIVKTIFTQVNTESYRVDNIEWDGLDNFGDPIGNGVYVYKLSVKAASDNSKATEFQKLVILR